MDDGTQVSKYLLDPAYLRELYLFELATTIALMRENISLSQAADFTNTSVAETADTTISSAQTMKSLTPRSS